jgi:mRNA-degrading endonuclease YafQ of YafQ-DinJ toxin-antitoxin module
MNGRDLVSKDFTHDDRRAVLRALGRLDGDERQPSLRVHQLIGQLSGLWSASASASLRIVFVRGGDGKKIVVGCSKHYDR